jgi:hypothetical protein
MLDWDAPLSEQPELMNIARRVYDEDDARIGSFTGEDLYRDLSRETLSDEAASAALAKEGIPGIRFYDGSSRTAQDGTRNIVVFNPDDITQVKRDGELVFEKSKLEQTMELVDKY